MTGFEQRWCERLLQAVIPGPNGLASIDLTAFWVRFQAAAPPHLRLGLRVATWGLSFAPLFICRRPLFRQSDPDVCLQRVAAWPVLMDLAEIVKVVACFAYFQDAVIQERVRAA